MGLAERAVFVIAARLHRAGAEGVGSNPTPQSLHWYFLGLGTDSGFSCFAVLKMGKVPSVAVYPNCFGAEWGAFRWSVEGRAHLIVGETHVSSEPPASYCEIESSRGKPNDFLFC
jgi:hypothetical protein